MDYPKAISVKALEKYRIQIGFEDGANGVLDLSEWAGKDAFTSWDKDNNFSKVFISNESGTIAWPGDLDIDTLTAWLQIKGISYEQYKSLRQKHNHALH